MPQYYMGFIHERNPPDVLLSCALEAERSGFDGIARSDHFNPGGSRGTPARREPGELVLQAGFSWADDDDRARKSLGLQRLGPSRVLLRKLARPKGNASTKRREDLERGLHTKQHRLFRP